MYIYSLTQSGQNVQRSDGAFIPSDPSNTDYQAYLAWVAAGNTPTPVLLSAAQQQQIAALSAACQACIFAGFTSNALGAAHTYPAKSLDQQNLSASVLASLMPGTPANWTTPFWCADTNGNWAYVEHTAAQIQQVGQDGKTAILACLEKNNSLAVQVMAATTVAQVQAIVWSNP